VTALRKLGGRGVSQSSKTPPTHANDILRLPLITFSSLEVNSLLQRRGIRTGSLPVDCFSSGRTLYQCISHCCPAMIWKISKHHLAMTWEKKTQLSITRGSYLELKGDGLGRLPEGPGVLKVWRVPVEGVRRVGRHGEIPFWMVLQEGWLNEQRWKDVRWKRREM